MEEHQVPGLYGVDTRQLTKIIRKRNHDWENYSNADIPFIQPISTIWWKKFLELKKLFIIPVKNIPSLSLIAGLKIYPKFLSYPDLTLKVVPHNYTLNLGMVIVSLLVMVQEILNYVMKLLIILNRFFNLTPSFLFLEFVWGINCWV